jgi:hypothetical protein
MGSVRKYREQKGTTQIVELPEVILEKLEHAVDMQDGLVDECVVCDELHITKKTLKNMVSCGAIPRRMYTVAVNGLKKFFIYPILGLKEKLKWKRAA